MNKYKLGCPCLNCKIRKGSRGRGICDRCYEDREIRDLYVTSKEPTAPDFYGKTKLPDEPTTYLPGSEEKIKVLKERATQKVSLFHPDDTTLEKLNVGKRGVFNELPGTDEDD
jgi:hypothetical protein